MVNSHEIAPGKVGLRAYDTAIGFRNLDERSATIADFTPTHVTGMAAVLAGALKGRDVIRDARKLKRIAADVLKINHWAFDKVVLALAEVEMVRGVNWSGGEISEFVENIPLLYDNIHETLGERWSLSHPSEIERQFLVTLDKLAQTPVLNQQLLSDMGVDRRAAQKLRTVGENAELIRYLSLKDGTEVAISPLHTFEHPDKIVKLFDNHPGEKIQNTFNLIRANPGFPILLSQTDPIMGDIVRLGLLPAPTVIGADHQERAFATMLYGIDPVFLTTKKQILDRALALIACVRCGEVSGGATKIGMPDRLLAALMNPARNYTLNSHSSTARQYAPLVRMGVIELVNPYLDRWGAHLIPTPDNTEAVRLARILLQRQGEGLPERGNEAEAATLLFTEGEYLGPIETLSRAQKKLPPMSESEVLEAYQSMFVEAL